MTDSLPTQTLQLRSTITKAGIVEMALSTADLPKLKSDQVMIRVEASPINPSDLGVMLGVADKTALAAAGSADNPVITAPVPEKFMKALAGRVGHPMPCGNEGGGTVIGAGDSKPAQALMGRLVGVMGGGLYTQYRIVNAAQCLPLPEGTDPQASASCFVNPLTALAMVETMKMEGHKALVHTAAASNLGQMLCKICQQDKVPLVNVVRKPEQEQLLKSLGAEWVCDSSKPSFKEDLTKALAATKATLAFDATGGGKLADTLLSCMEQAAVSYAAVAGGYGTSVYKQVYIYGGLDMSPTTLNRGYGFSWGLGGFLLPDFLAKISPVEQQRLKDRVAAEINTTFASKYTKVVSLKEALSLEEVKNYSQMATGKKYLVNPSLPV